MSTPSLITLAYRDWSIAWPLLGVCAMLAALYLANAHGLPGWHAHRTCAFLAGLVAIVVALDSGFSSYDDRLLSAHMVQHLLLIEVAPALLLQGRPLHLALHRLPPSERRSLGGALVRSRRLATPAICLGLFSAIVLGTHVPAVFDAAVRHPALHDGEHVAYLLAGLLVWWPLLGDPVPSRRLGAIGQLAYVTVAMLPMTLIGAYLDRDQSPFYPVYAAPTRALGLSPVLDQQRAGAIMWVAATFVMAVVGLSSVLAAMLAAERRQRARELHEVAR